MRRVKRPYDLGVRAEAAEATKQAIKAAALKAFAERPFDLVSLREIADEAQVTQQTVLRLFGSKAELLATVTDEGMVRAEAERDELTRTAETTEDVVRCFVGRYEHEHLADKAIAFDTVRERYPPLLPVIERSRQRQLAWLDKTFASYLPAGRRRTRCVAQLYATLSPYAWRALRTDCGLSATVASEALVASAMALARSFK